MATKKKKPAITVEEQVLVETGFTEQGKNVFSKRMKGLSDELFDKSVSLDGMRISLCFRSLIAA